jgi:DNA-nicking Smr family endonuclease
MGKQRQPSRDEIALWHHVMKDVRRREPARPEADAADSEDREQVVTAAKQKPSLRRPEPLPRPVHSPRDPELTHGAMPGVDRRSNQRLRRGQVEIDARIDLHGMTQSVAYQSLMRFLEDSWRSGRKCVLVITGKGLRETGEIGILRRQVPKWLNDNARHMIQGFSYAHRRHGGEGALYVLMRRRRP